METFLAFVWAPLLLYGLSVGLALLAERVLRTELPNALLAPTGLVVLVALVMPVYRLGGTSTAAVAVTLPCVIAGFVLARHSLRERLNPGAAGLAALAVYGLYLAPVALSGHWTWPGYNFVNDTAANFLFTDLLSRQGVTLPAVIDSTAARDPGHPGHPRLPRWRAWAARHGAADDGRRPAGRLPPTHRRHRRHRRDGDVAAGPLRRATTHGRGGGGRAALGRGPALPLRAARFDQGTAGGDAPGHRRRPRPRGARPRAQPAAGGARGALRGVAAARVQRGGSGLRVVARLRPARRRADRGPRPRGGGAPRGSGGGHRCGRLRGEPLGCQKLRRARQRGLRGGGRGHHRIPRSSGPADSARADRGRVAGARLSPPGDSRQRARERPADRGLRSAGAGGCRDRAAPPPGRRPVAARTGRGAGRGARSAAVALRRRQAAGGAVPGRLPDGRDRRPEPAGATCPRMEDRGGRRAGGSGGRDSHHRRAGLPGGHPGATRARRGDGGRGRPRRRAMGSGW